jgi:ribosomal protein S27E
MQENSDFDKNDKILPSSTSPEINNEHKYHLSSIPENIQFLLAIEVSCIDCENKFCVAVIHVDQEITCDICGNIYILSLDVFLNPVRKKSRPSPNVKSNTPVKATQSLLGRKPIEGTTRRDLALTLHPNTLEALAILAEYGISKSALFEWLLTYYPPYQMVKKPSSNG